MDAVCNDDIILQDVTPFHDPLNIRLAGTHRQRGTALPARPFHLKLERIREFLTEL